MHYFLGVDAVPINYANCCGADAAAGLELFLELTGDIQGACKDGGGKSIDQGSQHVRPSADGR